MRLPIHLQREIARLHFYDTSQSNRAIARSVGVSANTVREMRRILRKSDTFGADLHSLDDDAWYAVLGTGNKMPVGYTSPARRSGPASTPKKVSSRWLLVTGR